MNNERGRPRNFDAEDALDQAVEVFWRHGYQGASLSELTQAMGLNKPSLYGAFGDKEALYLKALQRYREQRLAGHAAQLATEPDARRAVEGFLQGMTDLFTDEALPGGCFIVNGSADTGSANTPAAVTEALHQGLLANEECLRERLLLARDEGQLPKNTNVAALAAMYLSLIAGIAVLAKSGASRRKLQGLLVCASGLWPGPP
ncbi:MAG TPA: TetR/AcrR family transcriptional regulator [Burkholderiaceae bacterium]|nr:TetR/AcrR family transcriptional regulator [Burkholderiaceae bacterium]